MKTRVRFTVIVSVLITSLCLTAFASQAPAAKAPAGWLNGASSFERAMQLQKDLKVPLVVYFYVDWCPYCHALEREYFPSAPVREYLNSVVKIRINPELTRADHELGGAFGIRGYPAFFVIAPGSSPVQVSPFLRNSRTLTPAEFAQRCRDVATPRATNRSPIFDAPKIADAAPPKFVSTTSLPTADAVMTRFARLTGTTERRATNRVIKGRIDIPGVSFGGRFELYSTASGKSLAVTTVDQLGTVRQGFDGQSAWTVSENTPSGVKSGSPFTEALLFREIELSNLYSRTKLMGKVKEGDRDVYVIEATPRTGPTERLYFDAENGLLLHRDLTRSTSRGPLQAEVYFSNWRNIDGFLIPHSLTHLLGSLTIVISIDEIKHNVAIDDAVFQRPANAVAIR